MFTFRLIAAADDVPSDHDATEWEIYDFKPEPDKVDEAEPIYFSGTLTSDLLQHDALLPYDHFDLNWGMNNHWIRVRFRSASDGWGYWSPLKFKGFNKPIKPVRAFDRGPIERGDNSSGLHRWNWMVELRKDGVYIARENIRKTDWREPEFLFTPSGNWKRMIYLDLTFDQIGRPVVCYEVMGTESDPIYSTSYLYWYDSNAEDYVVTEFPGVRNPRVSIDWRNTFGESAGETDVLFFYVDESADEVFYRVQRDRFGTEYSTGITNIDGKFLKMLEHTKSFRFTATYIEKAAGWRNPDADESCFTYGVYTSAPYPIEIEEKAVSVDSIAITKGLRKKLFHLLSSSHEYTVVKDISLVSGLRKEFIKYIYSPYEYLMFSSAAITSGLRKELILYFYFPYEYVKLSDISVTSGLRKELIIYKNSPFEYLKISQMAVTGGTRYEP